MKKLRVSVAAVSLAVGCASDPAPATVAEAGVPYEAGLSDAGIKMCDPSVIATAPEKVDTLLFVDSRHDLTTQAAAIQGALNRYAAAITAKGIDQQITLIDKRGMTTPYAAAICVPPPLGTTDCGDNPPVFHQIDQVLNDGSQSLDLLLTLYDGQNNMFAADAAILGDVSTEHWDQYVRPDALKALVVLLPTNPRIGATDFDTILLGKEPAGIFGAAAARNYVFHSIVGWKEGTPTSDPTPCSGTTDPGLEYRKVSALTGGTVSSICGDAGAALDRIATATSDRALCELGLPRDAGDLSDSNAIAVRRSGDPATGPGLPYIADQAQCPASGDGWTYDIPYNPYKIILCPATCAAVKASGKTFTLSRVCSGNAR